MKPLKRAKFEAGPKSYQEGNVGTENEFSPLESLPFSPAPILRSSQNVVLYFLVLNQNDRLLYLTALRSTLSGKNQLSEVQVYEIISNSGALKEGSNRSPSLQLSLSF